MCSTKGVTASLEINVENTTINPFVVMASYVIKNLAHPGILRSAYILQLMVSASSETLANFFIPHQLIKVGRVISGTWFLSLVF